MKLLTRYPEKIFMKPKIWFSAGLWRCRAGDYLSSSPDPFEAWLKAALRGGFWVCKPKLCRYCKIDGLLKSVKPEEVVSCLEKRGFIQNS